jgi:hypothetical protein
LLKPAANDVLQRWPVSRRVNSSRAPADDPDLIERVEVDIADRFFCGVPALFDFEILVCFAVGIS